MRLIITVEDDKPSPAASLTSVPDAVAENAGMPAQQSAVRGSNQNDGTDSFESALTDGATSAGAAPDAPSTAERAFLGESGALPGQTSENFDVSTATSAGAAPEALAASEAVFLGESPSMAEESHDNADTSAGPGTFAG
ncbi:hypothetical protein QMG83_12255 [Salinibacterium sp. G-O1]|uniref:hypothetical protein n=1 Tax=Salinibacterium sp. G-O1 TaxID=3046208 RepID=UPI0024B88DBE|nr:hypothetical protein [Salinibacterium sp. G-O1]MDJ0335998.1 hypothetical protein [Salinibacterium sp. G-O1]